MVKWVTAPESDNHFVPRSWSSHCQEWL